MKQQTNLVLVAILAILMALDLQAQSLNRGEIRGTVTDAQGAAVPGVKVAVTNTDTNVVNNLTTNESGFYLATELVPGTYTIEFRGQGFEKLDLTSVVVKAGAPITEDVVMRIGQINQTVDVNSAPPLVETSASNFSTTVSTQFIDKLPIVGRDIQTLVQI